MDGPVKAVNLLPFRREGWREAAATLRRIAEQIENGELSGCRVGALALQGENKKVTVFGFGPHADDLQLLGLFRLAEHKLVEAVLDTGEEP